MFIFRERVLQKPIKLYVRSWRYRTAVLPLWPINDVWLTTNDEPNVWPTNGSWPIIPNGLSITIILLSVINAIPTTITTTVFISYH